MGLLAAAQEHKTRIRGASFVDRDGNELFRDTESTPTGGPVNSPDIELLRDDLVELLYGQLNPALNTCSTTAFPHCRTTATRCG